jgi:sensor domain CHASE-containing protein
MNSITSKMLRIILLSLFAATGIIVILYFILLSLFIYQEKEKAKLITNVIFTTKYSQMHHINNSFNELITLYKKIIILILKYFR